MINPFWFKGVPNYGDILTPYILNRLGIKHQYASREQCDSIFIGSIAKLARKGVSVYGSGFIRKNDPVSAEADWRFVRGQLTREMVINAGGKCPAIYGDMALILPELVATEKQVYDV